MTETIDLDRLAGLLRDRSAKGRIIAAIAGALVRLTDEPWCSVFHQWTEK